MIGSLLYIAPTFLADRTRKQIRGVQVFDLGFVRELAELGVRVTVPAEGSWRARLEESFAGAPETLEVRYLPRLKKPTATGLWLGLTLRGRFEATFVGNPARGIIPCLTMLRRRGVLGRVVLQANKGPGPAWCRALRRWPEVRIAAVSGYVRGQFPEDLRGRVGVYYGITGAEQFGEGPRGEGRGPRGGEEKKWSSGQVGEWSSEGRRAGDDVVHFCLIGKLDNAWKGAERAVGALRRLTPAVRSRVRLHLASFADGRVIDEPGVVCHPWMAAGAVPGFLRGMDVMLVPSFGPEETFSQAMVQGMLSGLALITSDLPVLAEKLDEGGGIVCADEAALAAAMTRMVEDPAFRRACGATARRVALERYVWDSGVFLGRFLG